ncbi:kinase-like protein [Tilletiaria anomala UBC 951]|uniref:Kinase-like protein n=1 Tax=Tilletiaria anomala (strain ATCC 24038 / CBS 436.72 / UBC 951) TaxID=1037660 RepID=A0A066WAK7_TILAU|nr:kinase-like protein [Tilletiaria anomala UBC 951]KDN49588.1 kinase-like protein [Tilletiaria anomala UBC 951]
MANMLKGFWPSSPADQTTPKALSAYSEEQRNPFDTHAASMVAGAVADPSFVAGSGQADQAGMTGGNKLAASTSTGLGQRIPMQSGEMTPSGLRTPGGVTILANIPTTSLSVAAPDFTMQMPPKKNKDADITPSSSANNVTVAGSSTNTQQTAGSSTSATVGPAPANVSGQTTPNRTAGAASSTGPTRNTAAPRGHLTIKVVSARNLQVSSAASRPYAVVSFDKNEFIGREPMDDEEGIAATATTSSKDVQDRALKGTFGDGPVASRPRATTVTPMHGASSSSSPSHPVWKHEVKFDVTHENQGIFISVYDRHAEDEGFLGMRLIKPRLFHKMSSDQWYPLTGREELAAEASANAVATGAGGMGIEGLGDIQAPQSRGEIRIQIAYEKTAQKKLTPADFEYMKLIGRGTFGRVFQVRKKDTKRIYAMKVLSKREIAIKKEVTHTMGERKILEKSLDCPFLVGLKFSFQSDTELFFVTDYKSGGELFWHLQREGRFTEERARFYIAELVLALEHLHKYDIVYRDLKPENILLDATGHVALCDFGLSKPDLGNGQLTNTFCGTTEYLAPEVLLDESGYSKLVDFWSLGVLLFEMCCGWSPFYAEDTQQMYRNICFGKIKFPRGAIGDDGKQFVKGLLNRNPKHRLGSQRDAVDLKEHAFFKDIDFTALSQKKIPPPFKPLVESEESVANFDPEFTETDLRTVAEIDGQELSSQLDKPGGANGIGISGGGRGGEDDVLSSSVQHQFRGFSYSGRDDVGSFVGSRSRRGSNGFGLSCASFGMSHVESPEAREYSPSPPRAMSMDRDVPAEP